MAGLTFDSVEREGNNRSPLMLRSSELPSLPATIADPLVQDLGSLNRQYLGYYASYVCKDLVLYDALNDNPFRDLISMTQSHPMLLHIILASAALHMSNAGHNSATAKPATLFCNTDRINLHHTQSRWAVIRSQKPYKDALVAKQRAICALRQALMDRDSMHTDATLATILLFTEFELLDSGRDSWAHHLRGAREIISALWKPELSNQLPMSPLRSCLISTCMVFDIIGSTLTISADHASHNSLNSATLSLLQDAEGNHCSSFPAELLELVRMGAQLMHFDCKDSLSTSAASVEKQALTLLRRASIFDPLTWAGNLQSRSPTDDRSNRIHIAFAHRAAACVYLSRVLLSIEPAHALTHDLEAQVTDIVYHLSFIRPGDALLTASTWPAFIAGAETNDLQRQLWITLRFQELWEAEPWGLFRGALEVLEGIWEKRQESRSPSAAPYDSPALECKPSNWLLDLRTMGVDWLII